MGGARDPRFGAAVLKLAFLSGEALAPAYREIYEGTLRDLGLSDAEVEAYLATHRAEVEEACRKIRRAPPPRKGD